MRPRSTTDDRVLIVTGGYLAGTRESLATAAWKQLLQLRHTRQSWLEAKVKLTVAEPVLKARLYARRRRARWTPALHALVDAHDDLATPELTAVVLATALAAAGIPFECLTIDQLLRGGRASEAKLRGCNMVFASATFLRDLSELEPLVARLKRPWNRIVVGGALAGTLHTHWNGDPAVDVLAIGYGERLVPVLAGWMRSGFRELSAPTGGRIEQKAHTAFLFAGPPPTMTLDALDRPDWGLVERYHGADFRMIHYESVRGCPYRCAFCNYPFLFADTKFRTKSAERMADDWEFYTQTLGVEYITCLDSLFTMPRARLIAFCRELLRRKVRVHWICYARADDLVDLEVVALMLEAGCIQVQIGIESGDQGQLDRMNKRTTVRDNARALENCRRAGLTTVVSLIVGFPGETVHTLHNTSAFLAGAPPDFHFLATFSTRVATVPILRPENADRYDLVTDDNPRTVSPYWRHHTMSCDDVGNHVRRLTRTLIERRISLDAALFYHGILRYRASLREELLDFQSAAVSHAPLVTRGFDWLHTWIDRRLRADVARTFASRPAQPHAALVHVAP
ncbi:MAG: radical SAM protein [Gemmatimonadota bacterium]